MIRPALLAASLVLLAGGVAACDADGGGDGADAPSTKTFCGALEDFQDGFADEDPTKDIKGYVAKLKQAADTLEEVGTPDDMPADAQDGFELTVRKIKDLSDSASVDDLADISDVSDEDQKKLDALTTYIAKTCPDLGGETDAPSSPST